MSSEVTYLVGVFLYLFIANFNVKISKKTQQTVKGECFEEVGSTFGHKGIFQALNILEFYSIYPLRKERAWFNSKPIKIELKPIITWKQQRSALQVGEPANMTAIHFEVHSTNFFIQNKMLEGKLTLHITLNTPWRW